MMIGSTHFGGHDEISHHLGFQPGIRVQEIFIENSHAKQESIEKSEDQTQKLLAKGKGTQSRLVSCEKQLVRRSQLTSQK